MIAELLLSSIVALPSVDSTLRCGPETIVPRGPVATVPADDDLRALYEGGQDFSDFMDAAVRRRELWDGNWEKSAGIDMEMVARARAVEGEWHFLVVAIDSCSDSVSTIPYLARLVELSDNLHMRVVDPDTGAGVMESHPTPDGRASTPTVVLMNSDFEEVGCFIERPRWLRDHIIENPDDLDRSGLFDMKMAWYAENAGTDTVAEMVEMLEMAAGGEMHCASIAGM